MWHLLAAGGEVCNKTSSAPLGGATWAFTSTNNQLGRNVASLLMISPADAAHHVQHPRCKHPHLMRTPAPCCALCQTCWQVSALPAVTGTTA